MKLKTENQQRKINETKSWFFEKINKINGPLGKLSKKKRKRMQTTNIRNKREDITTDPMDVKRIIKEYYEQLYPQIWKYG